MRTFLFKGNEKAIFVDDEIDEALQNGWMHKEDNDLLMQATQEDVENLENEVKALQKSNTAKKKRGRPKKQ